MPANASRACLELSAILRDVMSHTPLSLQPSRAAVATLKLRANAERKYVSAMPSDHKSIDERVRAARKAAAVCMDGHVAPARIRAERSARACQLQAERQPLPPKSSA